MGTFSILHWAIVLIVLFGVFLPIWPAWRIANRAGYSGGWAILTIVPVINIVMIYVFAFSNWPAIRSAGAGGDETARAYTPGQHLNNEGPSA